jgi:hypothetical protein
VRRAGDGDAELTGVVIGAGAQRWGRWGPAALGAASSSGEAPRPAHDDRKRVRRLTRCGQEALAQTRCNRERCDGMAQARRVAYGRARIA